MISVVVEFEGLPGQPDVPRARPRQGDVIGELRRRDALLENGGAQDELIAAAVRLHLDSELDHVGILGARRVDAEERGDRHRDARAGRRRVAHRADNRGRILRLHPDGDHVLGRGSAGNVRLGGIAEPVIGIDAAEIPASVRSQNGHAIKVDLLVKVGRGRERPLANDGDHFTERLRPQRVRGDRGRGLRYGGGAAAAPATATMHSHWITPRGCARSSG